MDRFALATLATRSGPKAAIGVEAGYFFLSELLPFAAELASIGVETGHYLLSEFLPFAPDLAVTDLIRSWDRSFPLLQTIAKALGTGEVSGAHAVSEAEAVLLTPVRYPNKLLAVGANYLGHAKEMGMAAAKSQSMPFFFKPPTTALVGPGETVRIPRSTRQFDWECELTAVVSRRLTHASRAEAAEAIAGYTIGLDLSCRDLIPTDNEFKIDLVRGKAQDTMAPCGPHFVPACFVGNVDDLRIQLWVNGQKMMDASTDEMIFKAEEIVSVISEFVTLEPGDMIMTGSPAGSAGVHGGAWLKPGDRIHAEIAQIGSLYVTIRDD